MNQMVGFTWKKSSIAMVLRLRVETKRCSELETANLSVASVESSLFLLKTEDIGDQVI
jgi:hypothetical protein